MPFVNPDKIGITFLKVFAIEFTVLIIIWILLAAI